MLKNTLKNIAERKIKYCNEWMNEHFSISLDNDISIKSLHGMSGILKARMLFA